MNLPPSHILSAALGLLHMCAYTTRNWTLNDTVSRAQINALWEAIHPIPWLLENWHSDGEQELLMYLDESNEEWPSPNLKACYNQNVQKLLSTKS